MKGYFNNPELKKSSIILIVIMLAFLITNYFIIKVNNENLKKDYIKIFANITVKVVEKNPDMEKEIIPLMIKDFSSEEELRGREILEQYGLGESLDNSLFPHIKHSFKRNEISIFIVGLLFSLLLFILNYLQYGYFYENIREFSSAVQKVVHGNYNLKLSEEKEGDLSKLTKSFNSMGEIIRANISDLKREKKFLVDLLSDISHQLKTPLSSMILYNDILLNRKVSSEQRTTFLINNQNQLNRMQWLIQNLLKLAKIDANAIELEIEEQSLNETIEETMEILNSKAVEAKVKMRFNYSSIVFLKHDRLWLQEALINVIKNGIEHTEEGGTVNIELLENPVFKRIIVKDTGEGIEDIDLANVFKRFYKGKSSKKSDSIGIGLALAKSIIEKHGGYIEAVSKPNHGTSFIITFLSYDKN
jgi:signal transduction histidine kinase